MRLQLAALGLVVMFASLPSRADPPSTSQRTIDASAAFSYGQYVDTDHVFVETPSVRGAVSDPLGGWSVDGSYLVDVVSAASVDIVSTASRRWEEIRQAGTLNGAYKPGAFGVAANASVSSEPDYLSWSAGASISQDLFQKNVTWLLGYEHTHDVAGRTGTPFSIFSRSVNREGFKAGVTILMGRSTIASIVGDVIVESGDPSKPYRYIPLFAPGTSVPRGASIDQVTSLRLSPRPLEQLPLSRDRFSLAARLAHRFEGATLRLDERLYGDSWALLATTTDARFLWDAGERLMTGPHARFHAQTSVSFWQRAYVLEPGLSFPALRTGDRELGPLVNLTGGWSARIAIGSLPEPDSWALGLDLNLTSTDYLDDLYTTHRWSSVASLSLEAKL